MHKYTVVHAPQDLLPQVVGELLSFAANPDLVDVVHGAHGREIHAHPDVAEAWYQARQQVDKQEAEPVQTQVSAPVTEVEQLPDQSSKEAKPAPSAKPAAPSTESPKSSTSKK